MFLLSPSTSSATCDEESFRFNERKITDSERFTEVAASVAGKRLTYKQLTGKTLEPPIA